MVESGLTPMQALQTATCNPARYLGELDRAGTVGAGKTADLVLLKANPLTDIRNIEDRGGGSEGAVTGARGSRQIARRCRQGCSQDAIADALSQGLFVQNVDRVLLAISKLHEFQIEVSERKTVTYAERVPRRQRGIQLIIGMGKELGGPPSHRT
jgi:adenine deaminase